MRFESTFTNVLNHTNFAPPATQIDVPATFGVLSAPQTAERRKESKASPRAYIVASSKEPPFEHISLGLLEAGSVQRFPGAE